MVVTEHIEDLREALAAVRASGRTIGFVPTMGALHEGHASLLSLAEGRGDAIVASVFVNPTQFNQASDLDQYPRTPGHDLNLLKQRGCSIAFIPEASAIYPDGLMRVHRNYGLASAVLEARHRPGHFDGVLTVVHRLFDLVRPDRAYFGEKDFQQLALVRRMVREENLGIEIISGPTIREQDGLAMSSRNVRLSASGRSAAAHIPRILFAMRNRQGEFDPPGLEQWGRGEFHVAPGIELQYLEIIDPETFAPVADWADSADPVLVCAALVDGVRLIDNLRLCAPQ
ncbi:MAG: pantoate--beta-alanine ligase [Flavobacteriales bacterium]|jgi:pantoate--beta-alanine ligase